MIATNPIPKPEALQGTNEPVFHFYPHSNPDEALCGHKGKGRQLYNVPASRKCPVCLLLLADIISSFED